MTLKERVEQAFGPDAEERVLRFLREKELAGCGDDTQRWLALFEAYEQWRNQFLLWEDRTYVDGITGWNLCMDVCKLRLPEGGREDWTAYLYRMTLLVVINGMGAGERTSLAAAGKEYHNLSAVVSDYYVNADYVRLTQEQWLGEISELLERSWKKYQQFPGSSPAYHREMEKNYPKFSSILERLAQNTKCCEVVRMNQYGGDDTVWYFGRAQDDFCIMRVSDSM